MKINQARSRNNQHQTLQIGHSELQKKSATSPTAREQKASADFRFADIQVIQPKLSDDQSTDRHKLQGESQPGSQLMTPKEFKKAIEKSSSKSRLKAIHKLIKPYKNQPDVGKAVYLERLIQRTKEYTNDFHRGKLDDEGIEAIRQLKWSAVRELKRVRNLDNQKTALSENKENLNSEKATGTKPKPKSIDGKQYRISGRKPNRKVEEVVRLTNVEGEVYYAAIGEVVDFNQNIPVVDTYPTPIDLGDWYPRVTHLNGMSVKATAGINGASELQEAINQRIDDGLKSEGGKVLQNSIDVLYTYSATLGTPLDLKSCIQGKAKYGEDQVVESQKQIMLDAVRSKRRVIVSAHSRGTIKTDNAVRKVHADLSKDYKSQLENSKEVRELCLGKYNTLPDEKQKKMSEEAAITKFSPEILKALAESEASMSMDTFIKLIYAGNAVYRPSKKLEVKMFVTKADKISYFCGTHTDKGSRKGSHKNNSVDKLGDKNRLGNVHKFGFYAEQVGQEAAEDIVSSSDRT